MKASFFESIRYVTSQNMPAQWPLPPGCYEPDVGGQDFRSVIERLALVEELGFDWVSFSEHHYSSRILFPSPIVMASHLHKITIAVLGPIIPLNNPVRVAEELAMLDNLTQGRFVVGLPRGTTNEYLVYSVKPKEARERTTEGMELILKAWTESYPFGWEGCHFQYRTVSVWPRPLQQPYPPTYALRPSVRDALAKLDSRNIAGVPRPAFRDGALPTTFVGSPETVVKQVQQCREEVGAGVIDLAFQSAAAKEPQGPIRALELFGKEVLPRIREL
jgi:alkanesulfonate monooxygenase SsuD/methylene tetrahydromethanopterin reductase-like flavin-dependent oxidoreductase (luciferase family)